MFKVQTTSLALLGCVVLTACGSGSNSGGGGGGPGAPIVNPLEVIVQSAGFDQNTLDAIAAAEARIEALFTGNLTPVAFNGDPAYDQIRINVLHDPSIGSSMSASTNQRRADGTTLEGTVRIRDLVGRVPSAREAVATHEFVHVLQGGQFTLQSFCTVFGWTGPQALAAYRARVDNTATAVPTQGSDSGTPGCGHWSNTWAHPFAEPCKIGAGPAPEILNPSVGSTSIIGRITVGQLLDHRPDLPIDINRAEAYPPPATC